MTTVRTAPARRIFVQQMAAAAAAVALPSLGTAYAATGERRFAPQAGPWRTFEVTTRVDIAQADGATRVWLPIPSVNTGWQQSLESAYSSNGVARMADDERYGARMLMVEFAPSIAQPHVELTSRIMTQDRSIDWSARRTANEDAAIRAYWTAATELLPTGGIVRQTARAAVGQARTDVEKTQRIYDWIIANTFREPKVKGCGEGDIQTMLETGNLGGKCADLNALFVGMCRAVGVPARDVYGLRLVPSAFGYKELGGNPASLKGAQHCRAEVWLSGYGWVAMDPADVTKVMRQETAEWIKSPAHPVVAPVAKALFGGWEGNWMAYNVAHDVVLPGSTGPKIGFLMYPMAENAAGRLNHYAPDDFRYQITAREIKA
ncbi:MAG: transglutaminase domain-containing protein [Rhodoferax sp.]|nr:transglutaminase domain-containing protein [Rhodoferax sp.]